MKEFVEKLNDMVEEKIKVTSLEIIVTGTKDKPYFEIKYKEVRKEDYNIGYSSYDLNNVFGWKEKCFEIVNELAEEYNNGWIPCERELPKNGVDVLVWFEYFRYGNYNRLYQTTGISYTYNGEWSGFVNGSSGWSELNIVAWQPLPQPYHKQEELQQQLEWKDKVMKHFTKTE